MFGAGKRECLLISTNICPSALYLSVWPHLALGKLQQRSLLLLEIPRWSKQGESATAGRHQSAAASPPHHPSGKGAPLSQRAASSKRAGLWSGGWPRGLLRARPLLNALLGRNPISPGVFPPNRPVVDTRSCSSSCASGGGLGGAFFCSDFSHFVSCHATPQTGDRSAGRATKQARQRQAS